VEVYAQRSTLLTRRAGQQQAAAWRASDFMAESYLAETPGGKHDAQTPKPPAR
jgi:hypothetical protein